MTFKQLYTLARDVLPVGYLSVSTAINDHDPSTPFTVEWNIYHEAHGHFTSKDPEDVLLRFQRAVKGFDTEEVDI